MKFATLSIATLAGSALAATDLTTTTFDEVVGAGDKGVFVKFFAPWFVFSLCCFLYFVGTSHLVEISSMTCNDLLLSCRCGHCKKLAPTWNQLSDAFDSNDAVVIADVDCTVEKDLCSRFGVKGYPTLKYFTTSTGADGDAYEGGRDFDALKSFADDNLGPSCGPSSRDLCTAEELEKYDAVIALGAEAIAAEIKELKESNEKAETHFKDELQKLQDAYKQLQDDKDKAIADNAPRLRILQSVAAAQKKEAAKDEL